MRFSFLSLRRCGWLACALPVLYLPLTAQTPPPPPPAAMVYYGQSSWLGVSISDLSAAQAQSLGLTGPNGALVKMVVPNSPAAKAGLQAGDVIVSFRGRAVIGVRQLSRLVRDTPVHRTVSVRIIRARQPRTVQVTLAAHGQNAFAGDGNAFYFHMPPMPPMPRVQLHIAPMPVMPVMPPMDFHFAFTPAVAARMGLSVETIPAQLAHYFGDAASQAVLVRQVTAESVASRAGLQAGDVILSVAGAPVRDDHTLAAALDRQSTQPVTVIVLRQGRKVRLRLPPLPADLRPAAYNAQWAAWAAAEGKVAQQEAEALRQDLRAHAGEWRQYQRDAAKAQAESRSLAQQLEKIRPQIERQMRELRKQLRQELRQQEQAAHTVTTSAT
ncbi:MAG: PDZ domain-containing protein [Terriglobales bacterium]